jgi:hypothetical protein
MSTTRSRALVAAITGGLVLGMLGAGGAASASSVAVPPRAVAPAAATTLPQSHDAHRAAIWLGSQVNADGYVVTSGSPDLGDTALTILALAAADTDHAVAVRALTYMEGHVDDYVNDGGHDDPAALATLVLDAHVLHVNPADFGGTDLVTRLLKTVQTSGANVGLFGVQDPTYDGAYRQGLALAALAAVGVKKKSEVGTAIEWLQHQQCANGGWEAYRSSTTACTPSNPNTYSGPDTNSTALAIEGLSAQHAAIRHNPITFYKSLQQSSGGWGYYGGSADPDSTALVIQSLLALHDSVSAARFHRGTKDPVTALLSFQLADGAFYFPTQGSPNTANGLSTEQAVPALDKKPFPF